MSKIKETQYLEGFEFLPGALDLTAQQALLANIREIIAAAPLFVPRMPRTGSAFSVRMTNCGTLGWVSDAERGYRYQSTHPDTGKAWPKMPEQLTALWGELAPDATPPEACLINYYKPGARMGLHRDVDEEDFTTPVISISLGDTALFRVGGLKRRDKTSALKLHSGDIVILGGKARRAYHGIDRILPGTCALLSEGGRFNLTLRRVTE